MKKINRVIQTKPYFLWDWLEKILPSTISFNLYPPFLGAGIKIVKIDPNFQFIRVELKLNLLNKNYVGTHFGGSLFSMTDPFYMLMFLKNLGKDYIVWDKSAKIEFIKATQEDVYAEFILSKEEIQNVIQSLETKKSLEKIYTIEIKTIQKNETIAKVERVLFFRKLKKI